MSLDKIFDRFKARFTKLFAKDLKRIDPTKFRDKEFQELYGFIGVDMPEESEGPFVVESTAPSRDQRWTLPFSASWRQAELDDSVETENEHSEPPSSAEEDTPR